MEVIEYWRFLFRYRWIILAGLGLGTLLGVGIALIRPDVYEARMELFVQRQPDAQTSNYFTYDGYYAQQTAAAYTDNAIELLTSDEIVKRAAQTAGLSMSEKSLAGLKGAIAAKKDASQLISLVVHLPNRDTAKQFTAGLSNGLRQRTEELNSEGDKKIVVDPVNDEPYVVLQHPLWWLYGLAGAVLGLITVIVLSTGWDYSRHQRR